MVSLIGFEVLTAQPVWCYNPGDSYLHETREDIVHVISDVSYPYLDTG
jgi:hypothetical protein